MTKLPNELRQALAQQQGEKPLQVEDRDTHTRYVIVKLEVYERLQQAMDYDASEPDPRTFYPPFADAVKDDLDAPGMERYDTEAAPPGTP